MNLTRQDRRLLNALQRDATRNQRELAEIAGMSRTSCWRRIRDFEDAGLIERQVALLDPRKAGFGFSAIVHLTLARHEQKNVERFIKEVMRHPEVLECYATSGEADFHLRVVVEDIDAYNAFLDDFIFRLPGVSQVRSNIVLKEIKADTALPFRN